MISLDTNLLLYAFDSRSAYNRKAHAFIIELAGTSKVAISELVLVELYVLLRNAAILSKPLSARAAVAHCDHYRRHPAWRLVENAPVMNDVWKHAGDERHSRRRIFDVRLALTLQHHGVTEFATANTQDFQDLGFERVWNPLAS